MKYLRPKTAGPSTVQDISRDLYLYESKNAGVGSTGPKRDLFQERLALSGITGTTYEPYERTRHHKTQHCAIDPHGIIRVEPGKNGIGGRPLYHQPPDAWEASKAQDERLGWSRRPTSAPMIGKPNWIGRDKQVLCFDSFYQESIEGSQDETCRIRQCKLYFYLEDDSISIVEPAEKNSGLNQGRVVRRHQVPYKEINPSQAGPRHIKSNFITMWDLNVGTNIDIYGKIFNLVSCDKFTRHFLLCQGVQVPSEIPIPHNEYAENRIKESNVVPRRPYKKINTQSKFLENDGKVLRFQGVWNDGLDKRKLILMYYLSDETIQINEKHPESGGRYKAPTFLKRTRLPKDNNLLVTIPGTLNERTILNVVTTPGTGRRKKSHLIPDNNDLGSRVVQYYDATDLKVGTEIDICGKKIFLYDCDEFTREYYKVKYDREEMKKIDIDTEVPKKQVKEVPPYTGIGSEEDSLTSWLGGNSLEPKPPQRDFFKFSKLDRHGYDSQVLRFSARLVKDGEIDKYRKFVISYFMSDDNILISVLPEPGSGITPGKFIEKGKMKKPKKYQPDDPAIHSTYYSAQDFYVGGMLEINCHTFLLTAADEYVFDFMERNNNREQFAHSNIRVILDKIAAKAGEHLKQLMARFMQDDPTDSGNVTESVFRGIMDQYLGFDLSEHELITLIRKYRTIANKSPLHEKERLRSLIQADLRRDNFSQFDKLLLSLKQADLQGTGKLEKDILRRVLLSSLGLTRSQQRTQAVRHLLDTYLEMYEQQPIDYQELVSEFNWIENTARPTCPGLVKVQVDCWKRATEPRKLVEIIQYRAFMDDLQKKI